MDRESEIRRMRWAVAAALLLAWGCSGKDLSDLASSVKDAASQGAQTVADKAQDVKAGVQEAASNVTGSVNEGLQMAGSMDLTVDQPIKAGACYVSFLPAAAGREGVLQLQSYRAADNESFPSVFVRSQCAADKLSALNGQTLAAQVFVQSQQDGPVWACQTEPVQLKITAADDKQLTAEIVGGNLVSSAGGASQPVKGTLQGALQ